MKRSLSIGINDYPGTEADLRGCVNDALAWKTELKKRGFDWQDILLDDGAFLKAMTDAFADIIEATKPGDTTIITYSGHGSWVIDKDNDEPDGRDEALCPWDMENGLLTDDYLYSIFSTVPEDAHVVFISDSCHSGSVSKHAKRNSGPFIEKPGEVIQKVKYLPPSMHLTDKGLETAYKVATTPARHRTRDTVLLMSGCSDVEYSYDAFINGTHQGAFSHVALWTLSKLDQNSTYNDWYQKIREYLPHAQYPQTPQLFGSDTQKQWKIFE